MEEQLAFSDWINTNLGEDLHLTHILPLADSGLSLYDAVKDGILLCKIVNHSCSDTVDERVINIVLGLLWQIIRVSLEQCPGLANLDETREEKSDHLLAVRHHQPQGRQEHSISTDLDQ